MVLINFKYKINAMNYPDAKILALKANKSDIDSQKN